MGTPLFHSRICRSRLRTATRWNAALSRRSPTLPARAASGARWLGAGALCRPHWPLSRLSSAGTVPGKHHHQHTAARERGVLAADFQHFPAPSTAARAASAFSPGTLGRLGALSAAATLVLSVAHANRSAHLWLSSARARRGCSPTGCAYPCPTSPLAAKPGSNVSLAMLASLPPHHLRSLFMVSRSALLTSLALMWSWLLNSSKTPLASFFSDLFCSVCLQ